MAVEGFNVFWELVIDVLGHVWHFVFFFVLVGDHVLAFGGFWHQNVEVEPPRRVSNGQCHTGFVCVVGGGGVPEAAVHDQDASCWACGVHLTWDLCVRINTVVARGIVGGSMTA